MENYIDNVLEGIFGGFNLHLNIIIGCVLILLGIVILVVTKKPMKKGTLLIIWLCIGLGLIASTSGVVQLLMG